MVLPDQIIASQVVAAMLNERVISSETIRTGQQHCIFGIETRSGKYVLRMTMRDHLNHFQGAVYWQQQLIPLGVCLATFIQIDLEGQFSPFPALLMRRLPGDDLINIYASLAESEKRYLANEIVAIQALTKRLPEGSAFGFAESYERILGYKSWFDFLFNRFQLCMNLIRQAGVFDINQIQNVWEMAKRLEVNFLTVRPQPFMWDTSERNVIVYQGKISGIVDVDDMCFGDSLFVLGLTYTALEYEEHDTLYPDVWASLLHLNDDARRRLAFYRLFYVVWFMRMSVWTSTSNKTTILRVEKLQLLFRQATARLMILMKN